MNISPTEAEESLAAIQTMAQKTRQSIASGGTYITLIVTGIIWLIGFTCTQLLPHGILGYIWGGLSLFGGILGTVLGFRLSRRVHSPSAATIGKRIGLFWVLLVIYGVTAILIARPTDGKQATMLVVMFVMLGYLSMGILCGGGMIALGLYIRYRW